MDHHRQTEPASHTLDVSSLRKTFASVKIYSAPLSPQTTQDGESCLFFRLGSHFFLALLPLKHLLLQPRFQRRSAARGCLQSFANTALQTEDTKAWISCKAELGDTSGIDLRKCLHLLHQRPYSINQSEHSTDSDGCPEQKTGTGQSTGHPVQQSHGLSLLPARGLQARAREGRKSMLGPRELPALEMPLCCRRKRLPSPDIGIIPWKAGNREGSVARSWDGNSQSV